MEKIGILGGTFDPIHLGHLLMAETAFDQVSLDRVIWVPSYHPPHKSSDHLQPFVHRWAMVQQAIADHPSFEVSDVEASRPNVSYAINTLADLKITYPSATWFWIIGLDAFESLPRWYRGAEIASECNWLVAPRPIVPVYAEPSSPAFDGLSQSQQQCQNVVNQMEQKSTPICWQLLNIPAVGISSSLVRQYCRDRRSIRYLVPDSVRAYIAKQNLYQTCA